MRRRESRSDRELREMAELMTPEEREYFYRDLIRGMGTTRQDVQTAIHIGNIVLIGYSMGDMETFISEETGLSDKTIFYYSL